MFATNDGHASTVTVSVMSFNIRHCEGIDEAVDVKRIAKLINEAKPDLIALQEVDRGVTRSARRDMPTELASLTGMEAIFYQNIALEGGEYGNAVMSRFPIKACDNTLLTTIGDGEQRGAIRAVISIPTDIGGERDLVFIATHLDHRDSDVERMLSVDELHLLMMKAGGLPIIVAGDFNSVPCSRVHSKLKQRLRDAWELAGNGPGFTHPADRATRRIDYLWVSQNISPLDIQVVPTLASDHFAVLGRLAIHF